MKPQTEVKPQEEGYGTIHREMMKKIMEEPWEPLNRRENFEMIPWFEDFKAFLLGVGIALVLGGTYLLILSFFHDSH